ncbi:MAG: DUF1844 domain-containing protein [Candidatus Bathyarchaeota archaeon]|nr:MAG: DUF1844 domain-containing protein [Candidatus Bathyarchaeota archaeon]
MKNTEKTPAVLDITSLDVYVLLSMIIDILSEQAWQYMGLRVKPGTDKVEKDFQRARVAIDCIVFLTNKVTPQLDDSGKKQLQKLIADLQINFARVATQEQM